MTLVLVLLSVFAFCWAWNELFLRFAFRLGALSQGIPNQRRWESVRKPIIGGISFFMALLALGAWGAENVSISQALLAGSIIAFFTGLADDAYVMLPHLKFFGQIGAAMASLSLGGPQLDVGIPILSEGLTVFWYVAVMNAFNMMDNMDGTAGVIAMGLLGWGAWILGPVEGLIYAGLATAVGAFLIRNWYPSSFYMGDNGSQLIGYVLGYMGLSAYQAHPIVPWAGILGLVAVYALLAGDTFWVIVMRLLRGQSPFTGGTDHLTHRLARLGLKPSRVALILLIVQGLLGMVGIYIWKEMPIEGQLYASWVTIAIAGVGIGSVHLHGYLSAWRYAKVKVPR